MQLLQQVYKARAFVFSDFAQGLAIDTIRAIGESFYTSKQRHYMTIYDYPDFFNTD